MKKNNVNYVIEKMAKKKGHYICTGWIFSHEGQVSFKNKNDFKQIRWIDRSDVCDFYGLKSRDNNKIGFIIVFKKGIKPILAIECSNQETMVDVKKYWQMKSVYVPVILLKNELRKSQQKLRFLNLVNIQKGFHVLLHDGPSVFWQKVQNKIHVSSGMDNYENWYKKHSPDRAELQKQRDTEFPYMPKISIVTPVFNTPECFLRSMIESVQNQTYRNWELCIADGSTDDRVFQWLTEYAQSDSRIRIKKLTQNKGISGNSNEALSLATGAYIGLFDHDDLLTLDALYEVVKIINEQNRPDIIYSDEDKTDEVGKNVFQPAFKPDFSIDFLRACNYICHFTVIKESLLEKAGRYFVSEYDGAQDYDLILRCIEKTRDIYHIPKILYHWRVHRNSTAAGSSNKPYTHIAGKKALESHLKRLGIHGEVVDAHPNINNSYRIKYAITTRPMVSILIPTYEHIDDLKRCLLSIHERTSYEDYEILVIENNSKKKETFDFYKEIDGKDHIRVLYYKGNFNYARINNWAAKQAKGKYLVLINNDIEIITDNWLEEMLSYAERPDVGIVGAKLYYPDGTIQHAGIIIGHGGVAGHAFCKMPRYYYGYQGRAILSQNLSAVTAALLMVRKEVFDEVNGFDERYCVAFNDVDFCLRVREKKYLIVYDAFMEAYHYESKSRGAEDTPEKKARFQRECDLFYSRWGRYRRDPYYNDNLTLEQVTYSLKQ